MASTFRFLLGCLILVGGQVFHYTSALAAETWTEPAHWTAVGSVNEWIDIDLALNTGRWSYLDLTVSASRQREYYQRTLNHSGALPAVVLDDFLQLSEKQRIQRMEQAHRELALVVRWHDKLATATAKLGRKRFSARQSDVDQLGAVLEDLNNATGIDPSNPYTWHLFGWFLAQIGDLDRSEQALKSAERALRPVPAGELTFLRRRLALDRAWNLRDLGRPDDAREQVAHAEELGGPDFETRLLHGLLVAAAGDMTAATRYAFEVAELGAYGAEHGRNMPETSRKRLRKHGPRMAASWILALAWIETGYKEEALAVFPDWKFEDRSRPVPPFEYRFWRDAGFIYTATGRPELAAMAWHLGLSLTPYRPYFVYQAHSAPVGKIPGLDKDLPFYLNFGLFPGGGSRFAYGLALAQMAQDSSDPAAEEGLVREARNQLFICLRTGEFKPQTYLALEDLFRATGGLPQANDCRENAVLAFENQGYSVDPARPGKTVVLTGYQPKDLMRRVIYDPTQKKEVIWKEERSVQEVLDEIQDAYIADRTPENRRALARFLIRNLQVAEGRELLLKGRGSDPGAGEDISALADEDLVVLLEADRQDGSAANARQLVDTLPADGAVRRTSSEIWALTGAILLENGDRAGGLTALSRALELDPDNGGLRMQLQLLGN